MSYLQEFSILTQKQRKFLRDNLRITYIADTYNKTTEAVNIYKNYNSTHIAIPLPFKAYLEKCEIVDDYNYIHNTGPNDGRPTNIVMSKFNTNIYPLYPPQKDVVNEAMKQLFCRRTCILKLPCSFGKTIMSIYMAHKLGYKTLAIVHRNILIDQWKDAVEKFTNMTVQIIQGKTIKLNPNATFYISTPLIIAKKEPEFFESIGTLILDECHALCTPSFMQGLFNIFPVYAISLSATPYRKDDMHNVLFCCFGHTLIERRSIRDFNLFRLDTGIRPIIQKNYRGKIDWNIVISSLGENKIRNSMIVATTQQFIKNTILIICKRVNHVTELRDLIENIEPHSTTIMTGNMKSYDHSKRILISTYSKLGVGFDDPRLNLEILADSCMEVEQVAGRVFRDKKNTPIIVDIVDNFVALEKHWNLRKEWYLSSGAKTVEKLILKGFEKNSTDKAKKQQSKKTKNTSEKITMEINPTKRLRTSKKFKNI